MKENTVVTIGDMNYLWGIFMLIASMRQNGMDEPVLVGGLNFTDEAIRLLQQFPDVRVAVLRPTAQSLTCRKPEVMLLADPDARYLTWVDSDGFFIGPDGLPSAPLLSADSARARGGKITRFARTNGISEKNLLHLVDLFRSQPDTVLTAALLSQRLGVTPRSASRILLKLGDLGLVSILPDRRTSGKGRPVRCYSFASDLFRQTFL